MLAMRESTSNNNKGFTFIELVVSIAIISILLVAGAMILSTSLTTVLNEGQDTDILYQAQDAMEKLVSGEITVDSGTYPMLTLESALEDMTINSEGNPVTVVSGTTYIIKEASTNEIVLTAFIPETD